MSNNRSNNRDGDGPAIFGWRRSMRDYSKSPLKTPRPGAALKAAGSWALLVLFFAVLVALWIACERIAAGAGPPPRGWSLPVEVIDVYDGDTVTVDIKLRARVRLLDCWAPEKKDNGGIASRDALRAIANGKSGVLFVPRAADGRLDKHFTFGRVLGTIWIDGQEKDLSTQQVEAGHATRTKGGP